MGDIRFRKAMENLSRTADPVEAIRALDDAGVVAALAGSAAAKDPYLVNVLATEALNRVGMKNTVMQTIREGVLAVSVDGTVTFANEAAGRLVGRERQALIGLSFHDDLERREDGGRVPRESSPVARTIATAQAASEETWWLARADGGAAPVAVSATPILRDDEPWGAVVVVRDVRERLQAERRRAARLAVLEVLASASTPEEAIRRTTEALGRHLRWSAAHYWRPDRESGRLRVAARWFEAEDAFPAFREASDRLQPALGEGLPGATWAARRPVWIEDLRASGNFLRAEAASASGLAAGFAFPVARGGEVLGILELFSTAEREADPDLLEMVATIGAQVGEFLVRTAAEAELRASESRKAAILASSLDAIITIDAGGRVLEWNTGAERMFGWTREEAMGSLMAELIVPARLRGAHLAGIAHYLRTGEGPILGRRVELPAMRRDRSEFPSELIVAAIPGAEEPLFTGYLRDLTHEKELLARVRASEDRYRALYEDLPLIYLATDAEGIVTTVNRWGAQHLGYEPDELVGRPIEILVHPEDRAFVAKRFARAHQDENVHGPIEFRKIARDGRVLWVSETMRLVADPVAGARVLMVCEDVSEWREAKERMEASAARIARILESVTDAFFSVDHGFRFVGLNSAAERLLGYSREHLLGRSVWEVFPEAVGSEFEKRYRRAMETGEAEHFEGYYEPLGTWFEVHAYPSEDGMSVYFRDVSERRRAEEEIRRFNSELESLVQRRTRQLERTNEELEAFNWLVGHDLKEPVRAVEAFLAALEEDYGEELSADARALVERARGSAGNLAALLRGLLQLGHAGRLDGQLAPQRVADVLASPSCSAQYEPLLRERGGRLEVDEAIPPVLATPASLCQVLGNLIGNGLRHSAAERPVVRITGARVEERMVEIRVDDNGAGFPPEVLASFRAATGSRAPSGSLRRGGSSGFGMLIVRRALLRLGGTIDLGSAPDGGARVVLRLPAA